MSRDGFRHPHEPTPATRAPSAQIIGAVNTVVLQGDLLVGENTDGQGFVEALRPVCTIEGQRVLLFGAGGAARAVAVELALAGAVHITVVNRGRLRGQELADLITEKTGATAEYLHWQPAMPIPAGTGIVVNATSIGLYPNVDDQLDIDWSTLRPDTVVADAIPNPPRTHLISTAEAGVACTAASGSQRWSGHSGALTANANRKPPKSMCATTGATVKLPLLTASAMARKSKVPSPKLLAVTTYNPTSAASMTSPPNRLYSRNFTAAGDLCVPP